MEKQISEEKTVSSLIYSNNYFLSKSAY